MSRQYFRGGHFGIAGGYVSDDEDRDYFLTHGYAAIAVGAADLAWVFVGSSNVVETTTTSHALVTTGISGLSADDLLIACISSRIASTTSVTLPTGGAWTLVDEQKSNNVVSGTSAIASGVMAYAIRGASDPNLTFTHPTAPSVALGRIVAYRNVNTSSPKDTQTSATTAANTTAINVAGLTTTLNGDLIVVGVCGGSNADMSNFHATAPSNTSGAVGTNLQPWDGWEQRTFTFGSTTGGDTGISFFDAVKTVAGATGNLLATAATGAGHVVIAGAFKFVSAASGGLTYVKHSGTWKTATTYVKHSGTWKIPTTYVKHSGTWKQV